MANGYWILRELWTAYTRWRCVLHELRDKGCRSRSTTRAAGKPCSYVIPSNEPAIPLRLSKLWDASGRGRYVLHELRNKDRGVRCTGSGRDASPRTCTQRDGRPACWQHLPKLRRTLGGGRPVLHELWNKSPRCARSARATCRIQWL